MKTHVAFIVAAWAQFGALTFTASAHPGSGIVVDAQDRVYFNEAGDPDERLPGSIWQIDAQGKLTRLKVGGAHYLALDTKRGFAQSNLSAWFDERVTPWLQRVDTPDGSLIQADGQPLAAHRNGSLYYAKRNLEVVRLTPDGKQTTISSKLNAAVEELGGIKGLTFGPKDDLYIACPGAIVKLEANGTFSTVAHSIAVPDCDADLPPGTPESHSPFLRGLAVNAQGMVFAAATGCRAVVKVSPDGKSSVAMRSEKPWSPTGIAVRGDDVYVLEYEHPHSQSKVDWRPRVRKLKPDGKVTTLATLPTAQSRPVRP